jgi:hypothetical protein
MFGKTKEEKEAGGISPRPFYYAETIFARIPMIGSPNTPAV